jgi:hypothetical protein
MFQKLFLDYLIYPFAVLHESEGLSDDVPFSLQLLYLLLHHLECVLIEAI